jgi:hypothetical protein
MLLVVSGQGALVRERYVTGNADVSRRILSDRRRKEWVDGFWELYDRRCLAAHIVLLLCIETTIKPLRGSVLWVALAGESGGLRNA